MIPPSCRCFACQSSPGTERTCVLRGYSGHLLYAPGKWGVPIGTWGLTWGMPSLRHAPTHYCGVVCVPRYPHTPLFRDPSRSLPVPVGLVTNVHDTPWYTARNMWIYLEISPRITHHTRQGAVPACVGLVPVVGLL